MVPINFDEVDLCVVDETVERAKQHSSLSGLTYNMNTFVSKLSNFWDNTVGTEIERDEVTKKFKTKHTLILAVDQKPAHFAVKSKNERGRDFESVMGRLQKEQSKTVSKLNTLHNPELQKAPDYVSEALKLLTNETNLVKYEIERIFDLKSAAKPMAISNGLDKKGKIPNKFDCLPGHAQYGKVILKGHVAPLLLQF